MQKMIIEAAGAPEAAGPYSHAVRVGNLLFTAGQIPMDPATGQLVEGDITVQTEQVMQNLQAVLAAAGTGFDQVIKATVFLADINDFGAMNGVYGRYFSQDLPARSAFQVVALPRGAGIEIEMIALIQD